MKKLLSLLSVLTISGTAMPNVIAARNYEKNDIKDLSELIWTDLNKTKNKRETNNNQNKHVFKTNGSDKPTEQQIKDKLKELNPQLDITKINVTNITENSARIISNDNTFYSGNPINVNYTVSIQSINW